MRRVNWLATVAFLLVGGAIGNIIAMTFFGFEDAAPRAQACALAAIACAVLSFRADT